MRHRILVSSVVILLMLAVRMPGVALAHDGSARLELNHQQTSSGAELEIRGVNIAPEQPIVLALIGAGSEYPLGTAIGDEHGDFVIGIRLPAEALAGAYTVRAFGANRVVVVAQLTLVGSAADEGGERRDQSELQLAPLPQPNPAQQPQAEAQPQAEPPSQRPLASTVVVSESAASGISPALLAAGGFVALALALVPMLIWRRKGTRRV